MDVVYGGFWRRLVAMMIDVALAGLLLFPFMRLLGLSEESLEGGSLPAMTRQVMLNIPAMLTAALFLYYRSATPGKLIMDLRVVDAATLGRLSPGQALGRQLAYIVSLLPFFLGFVWIAFDARRQGWHDKLAGTVVVYRDSSKGVS